MRRLVAVLKLSRNSSPARVVTGAGGEISYCLASVEGAGKVYHGSQALSAVEKGVIDGLKLGVDYDEVVMYSPVRVVLGTSDDDLLHRIAACRAGQVVRLDLDESLELDRRIGRFVWRQTIVGLKLLEDIK